MKRNLCFLSIFLMTYITLSSFSSPLQVAAMPQLSARSAVLIDVETGQVLYNKHMHLKAFPASLTKVLTTIIALEEGNSKELVTVSRRAAYQEGSSIYLREGEKIKLEDLLYGVMLASGNDAAVAVAEHIAGSIEGFAELMNEKAREMGALNSNFVNPSGLPDSAHYSTAYDLAMIMRYALQNEKFREITGTKQKTIPWADNDWGRGLRNHNKLLWQFDDITGGKTGYTKAAGRCLIASAIKDGREVVAVVLNDPDDWLDIRKLLDFGLENFKSIRVVEKGEPVYSLAWEKTDKGRLDLLAADSLELLVPAAGEVRVKKQVYLKEDLNLPVRQGEEMGILCFLDDYKVIAETPLVAAEDLHYNSIFLRFWHWLREKTGKKGGLYSL
ncbi:MAG: D-alanyl-D-alanine carboxypeptidase [Halanaerobiaceae bacterium]|nr:D-alanyl-D-alanine carboxypeptidase [Halanaerobiaceae bacterium]